MTALKKYAKTLGLQRAIDITGSVSDGELAARYRAADVFVCLSEHEGFGVPLLEAMHHRIPVVAFAAAAVPETVAGAAVLLRDKSPATVAAAVHRVITDGPLRDALISAGEDRLAGLSLRAAKRSFRTAIEGSLSRL
jgi:glycosyltransferase involved in cell wall biosynthesis